MPPTPLAGNAVTGTHDQAGALDTGAPAPVTPSHGPHNARALLPRRAARRAQTASPARVGIRGSRLRRVAGLLRRVPKTGPSYYDPLFERPDLVEDDYYRLRNQPRG
jgi:hypothetical protein